jgi:hypothetical protein
MTEAEKERLEARMVEIIDKAHAPLRERLTNLVVGLEELVAKMAKAKAAP